MRIEPGQNQPPLRLIQPPALPQELSAPDKVNGAQPRSRAERADQMSFESVYVSKLPRLPYTDAQVRLENLRQTLIAAKVDLPIHFEKSPDVRSRALSAYAKLTPSAADVNETATERAEGV